LGGGIGTYIIEEYIREEKDYVIEWNNNNKKKRQEI
jgi:hypothetical protein